ncbi:SusC/RagA family TonB-linked outer membrane protein [Bacteroidota bacterium]
MNKKKNTNIPQTLALGTTRFLVLVIGIILLTSAALSGQSKITLRGTIMDDAGEAVIGATLVEYDEDRRIISGTVSDVNGNFQISVKDGTALIVASCIGYKTQEFNLNNRNVLKIVLEAESIGIDEVVITASSNNDPLTNVAQRDQTSSRVKVDMIDSKHLGAVSAEEALQGQVSGLDIISNSGDPGSGSQIVIRGLGSIGNAKPLIVVDGISMDIRINPDFDFGSADQEDIGDLVSIAPQDIKSIDVLKDAAASAIWGSKGANGVLLIETYRGTQGQTRFDYQGKYTWNVDPPPIPMLNGNEYIMLQLEEHHNALGEYTLPDQIAYDPLYEDFYNYSADTDWLDAITRTGFISDQYFKVSGGGGKTRYFTSLNYHSNTGPTLNTSLERISTRINLDYNVSDKLKFSVNFSYTNSLKEGNYLIKADLGNGNRSVDVRKMALIKSPNMSILEHDQFGNLTGEYFTPIESYQGNGSIYFNPVAVTDLSSNDALQNIVFNSYVLNYTIFPWMRFRETISFQYLNEKSNGFLPYNAIGADWIDEINNESFESNSVDTKITSRSQLFIIPRLGPNHSFSTMFMFETDQRTQDWSSSTSSLGPSIQIIDPASNAIIQNIKSGSSDFRALGGLASVNYKLKDRYISSFNLRADGSSKFGSNRRWGIFPSASLGWRFSEETFMNFAEFLDDGKIRASYGVTGREPGNPYDRHAIYNTADPGQYIDNPFIIPQRVQLDNLKWETMSSWNLGLDLLMFENRITFTGEIYNKTTEDILWRRYDIPSSSGFERLNWFNGGSLENRGWELFIRVIPIKKKDFSTNLNFNISQNINSFLEFPDNFNNEVATSIGNGQFPRRAEIDQPIGSFYGFRYQGVWASTSGVIAVNENGTPIVDSNGDPVPLKYGTHNFQGGDAIYEDVNHDGVINLNDVVYLGDSNPDFFGGLGGGINYKDFRFSFQFLYRLGFQIVNEVAMNTEGMLNKNNQSKAVLHRWRVEGQDEEGMLPRAYLDHPANNLGSDRYVEDGDFVKLNNLSLRYRLNKKYSKRFHITSMDVALTMRKILTFTNYSGQNPEIPQNTSDPFWFGTDNARTPTPQAYTLSFSIGF